MKKRTKAVAWLFLMADAALLYIAVAAFMLDQGHLKGKLDLLGEYVLGLGALSICALLAFDLVLWYKLLDRKAWAWWSLTVLHACWLTSAFTDLRANIPTVLLNGLLLLVLLTDRKLIQKPKKLRKRRKSTSARRYYSYATSRSRRPTTKRRRRRRDSYYYD